MTLAPVSPSRPLPTSGSARQVVVHETFILQRSALRFSPDRVAAALALQAALRRLSPDAAAIVLRKGQRGGARIRRR